MSNSHRGPSIDSSFQGSFYLTKLCQSRRFLEIDQSEKKNCLWRSCLLTDWDKISNIYKRTFHRCFQPSFGSFGLAISSEKIFRNRPIRKKNRLWWPCLLMDWNIFIEVLPQILPTKFRCIWPCCFRGEDFQKQTNQKQELPVAAMFANGLERNEHSVQRTAHRCFLPCFGSFGQKVSQENIIFKSANQKKGSPVAAMFVNRSERNEPTLQRTYHRWFLPIFSSFG